ncbi:response regulator transcription factor [Baekduia soli]|uniref:Response regulator transcription factor n=1 Tax=Baekduia soli TaxID=496014 RepID=A0A5B8UBB5_9ACTN|nr:response regulator transcription factor [Baekduia soli]QEC50345.1 response regulator transcription factor [Baekduia soli]
MDTQILLVEDDDDLREAMAGALASDGHDVQVAADGNAALAALAERRQDLVLLDVALGAGPDGVEVCRRLRRADSDVYVMMLTARDGEAEVVLALEAGADDYVTKPVGISELRSRVRAALRRLGTGAAAPAPAGDGLLRHEALALDPAAVRVEVGGTPVALTRSEFAVLEALLRAGGAVRSRTQLLHAVYGDDAYRDPRGVDVHVHHVREKLAHAGGDEEWIVTVRGAGYRIGR